MSDPNDNGGTILSYLNIVIEIFIIVTLSVVSLLLRQLATPYHRGFYRTDESIMYPYKDSTVPAYILYIFGYGGTIALVIITEFVILKQRVNSSRTADRQTKIWKSLAWNSYKAGSRFAFGIAVTQLLTNLFKYGVGRLRPHFIDICEPDYSLLTSNDTYITEDICTGEDKQRILEGRLSFPSGHSSAAMYAGVFICLYLAKRFDFFRAALITPTIQLGILCLSLYTCISRISDYKHHWSDVLAGGLLGTFIAVGSFLWLRGVSDLNDLPRRRHSEVADSEAPSVGMCQRNRYRDESSQTSEDELMGQQQLLSFPDAVSATDSHNTTNS